jgi:hypothetical protein
MTGRGSMRTSTIMSLQIRGTNETGLLHSKARTIARATGSGSVAKAAFASPPSFLLRVNPGFTSTTRKPSRLNG